MNIYTNLADSVHYSNFEVRHNRLDGTAERSIEHFEDTYYSKLTSLYKKELLALFEQLLQCDSNETLAFTLNQVADNPIFYENNAIYLKLKELFDNKKGFISTFRNHSAASYLRNNILSHWKTLCGGEEDDTQFLSSFLGWLCGKMPYSTYNGKGLIHYIMFGIGAASVWSEMANDEYINDIIERQSENRNYNSFYMLLNLYVNEKTRLTRCESDGISIDGKDVAILPDMYKIFYRLKSISEMDIYKPNATFVNENGINLSSIMEFVLDCDGCALLYDIYLATSDSDLLHRLRRGKNDSFREEATNLMPSTISNKIINLSNKERLFLMKFRDIMKRLSKKIEKPDRSKYYNTVRNTVIPELSNIVTRNQGRDADNNTYNLMRSFMFQFVDFCYNLYNALLTYGEDEFVYQFYAYSTSPELRKNRYDIFNRRVELKTPIKLSHSVGDGLSFRIEE